jgi:hypothetical protein
MKRCDLYRQNAEKCTQMALAAHGGLAHDGFTRMRAVWLALAEEQDLMDRRPRLECDDGVLNPP